MSISGKKAWFLFIFILFTATFFRLVHIKSDSPIFLSWSNAATQDATWYTANAVQKALGHAHVTYDHIDKRIDRPIFTYYCYLVYTIFGLGFGPNTIISALSGLISICLLFFLLRAYFPEEKYKDRLALLAVLFLSYSSVAIFYDRIPLLYPTISCYCLLTISVWLMGTYRHPLYFLAGWFLLALGVFGLKVLVATIAPALVFGHLVDLNHKGNLTREGVMRVFKKIQWYLLTVGVLSVLALILAFQQGLVHYVLQMYTAKLAPQTPIHSSPFMHLLEYGSSSRILIRSPFILLLAFAGVILVFLRKKKSVIEVLFAIWFMTLVLGTLPLQYRPLRFVSLLLVPGTALASLAIIYGMIYLNQESPSPMKSHRKAISYFLSICLSTYFIYHLFRESKKAIMGFDIINPILRIEWLELNRITYFHQYLFALGISLIGAGLFLFLHKRPPHKVRKALLSVVLVLPILGSLSWNLYQTLKELRNPTYSEYYASREIPGMIGENAYLSGAYAHALSLETKLRRASIFRIDISKSTPRKAEGYVDKLQKKLSENPLNLLYMVYNIREFEEFNPQFADRFRQMGYTHMALPRTKIQLQVVRHHFHRAGHRLMVLRETYLRGWEVVLYRIAWDKSDPTWHVVEANLLQKKYSAALKEIQSAEKQLQFPYAYRGLAEGMASTFFQVVRMAWAGTLGKSFTLKAQLHLRQAMKNLPQSLTTHFEKGVIKWKIAQWFANTHKQALKAKINSPIRPHAINQFYGQAIQSFEAASKDHPQNASIKLYQAYCLFQLRNYKLAESYFLQAEKLNPYDGSTYRIMSEFYEFRSRQEKKEARRKSLEKAYHYIYKARLLAPWSPIILRRGKALSTQIKILDRQKSMRK